MATRCSILAWRIPTDRGAWWATVHGVAKRRRRLSNQAHTNTDASMSYSKLESQASSGFEIASLLKTIAVFFGKTSHVALQSCSRTRVGKIVYASPSILTGFHSHFSN